MREAIWWAGLSILIVFVLLSFTPIYRSVMLGKLILEATFHVPQSPLRAVVGGNRWFYPPLLLLQESTFWVLASMAAVSTFVGSILKR